MAHMLPPDAPLPTPGRKAERELWDALRHGLSDDYYVYYGLHYLGDRAEEGEVDFLILHREHGMLVVECKGGGVTRRADGQWIRSFQGRDTPMHSPFEQAQRQMHTSAQSSKTAWTARWADGFRSCTATPSPCRSMLWHRRFGPRALNDDVAAIHEISKGAVENETSGASRLRTLQRAYFRPWCVEELMLAFDAQGGWADTAERRCALARVTHPAGRAVTENWWRVNGPPHARWAWLHLG